ncbi:MAG: glycosyltransferase family 4 protein [Gammaproteobacteria bacterium]|nr:glycosyltransferase family 4 protein [Gammaproteobacteria bacterium]
MKVLIDLQAAQTRQSKYRGIGKYSLNLIQAVLTQNQCQQHNHELLLFYNSKAGHYKDNREYLQQKLGAYNEIIWTPAKTLKAGKEEKNWNTRLIEHQREQLIQSYQPDIIYINSLFEGIDNNATTSIKHFYRQTPTVATVYDLIPYLYPAQYLNQANQSTVYLQKIKHLKRADHLFAISETTRQEVVNHVNYPEHKITNISSDADNRFKKIKLTQGEINCLKKQYNIKHDILMFVGNLSINDPRKNIKTLIKAYKKLPQKISEKYQLLLVGPCQEEEKAQLLNYCQEQQIEPGKIHITNYVNNDDLLKLYNICQLFIFPSLHEGFGLPVLEAMRCHTPVITANTDSMKEVFNLTDAMFDPKSEESIKNKIIWALSDKNAQQKIITHCQKQAKQFSWQQSAETVLYKLEQIIRS